MNAYGLIADIGGTNVRFAVVDTHERNPIPLSIQTISTKDHPDIAAAARAYLSAIGQDQPPAALVFAVAGPVTDGEIHLTNAGWTISEATLRDQLRVKTARVVNDFEALAETVPHLGANDLLSIGTAAVDVRGDGTIAIIGPGTGLGVAGFIRRGSINIPLVTEGGHAAFAPFDDLEISILQILRRKFGHVSAERILSGPGLLNLYGAMAEIEGVAANDRAPEKITLAARDNPSSFEARVFDRFCMILGSVAGDVALTMGARLGVLIAGGILPDVSGLFAASGFRARFEDKGRFADYMKAIPTSLILEKQPGLLGAAAILLQNLPMH